MPWPPGLASVATTRQHQGALSAMRLRGGQSARDELRPHLRRHPDGAPALPPGLAQGPVDGVE
eukprot:10583754-Lingulodinium_polyedra.AAC.1